jgi:hypothetical protein
VDARIGSAHPGKRLFSLPTLSPASVRFERRALQIAIALACVIPIAAGGIGALAGPAMLDVTMPALDLDSHYRYLSGLLLAIGVGFISTIPRIETHRSRFQLLTLLVIVGGIARLVGLVVSGAPSPAMLGALMMELGVTPALALWQARIAR